MAKRKPVIIDGEVVQVAVGTTLSDVVQNDVGSVLTSDGALIPRSEFRKVPVPDGFETNLSHINKGRLR